MCLLEASPPHCYTSASSGISWLLSVQESYFVSGALCKIFTLIFPVAHLRICLCTTYSCLLPFCYTHLWGNFSSVCFLNLFNCGCDCFWIALRTYQNICRIHMLTLGNVTGGCEMKFNWASGPGAGTEGRWFCCGWLFLLSSKASWVLVGRSICEPRIRDIFERRGKVFEKQVKVALNVLN